MIKKTFIQLLLLTAFNANALDLFKVDYTVLKDGKKIGISSMEVAYETPFYTLTNQTNGTHGMASFLGFKRTEKTLFTEDDGNLSVKSYDMTQKVAFSKRHSEYAVDSKQQLAVGNYKGDEWQLAVPSEYSSPNLVALNLAKDICAGKTENLNYKVVKGGKLKEYKFSVKSSVDGIIEVDKIHSKASRITKTWFDTNQQCIAIKTYHIEKGQDPLETKLVKYTTY